MARHRPYQIDDSGEYWDYNFKILGVCFSLSVNRKTGLLFITRDRKL